MGDGMIFNINTAAIFRFTARLDRINRSALPVAVRSALNDVVFDVKTRTMPLSANKEFTQRTKNFFTANSKFEKATGFDIKTMKASVGFYENRLSNKGTNYAVRDLEEQESGGEIDKRTFVPTIFARAGKRHSGLVRPNFRIKALRNQGIIESKKVQGKFHKLTKRQQFVAAANKAGIGGNVIYNGFLYRIESVMGRKVEAKPLYSVKKGRSVNVQATHFMKEASTQSAARLEDFYARQAQRQLKKHYGKV